MNARQWMEVTAVVAALGVVGSAGANDTQSHRLLNGSSASSDTNLSNDGNSGSVDGNAVSPRSTRNSEGVRASQDNTGRSALGRGTTSSESRQPGSDNGSSPSIVNDGTPSGRKMSNDDADKNGVRNDSSNGSRTSTQRSTTQR